MVSTGIEFKGGDVAEWCLTGELVCRFAPQQLPDTDVQYTMNNTFIVLGWVWFSHAGFFVSVCLLTGARNRGRFRKMEETHQERMFVLPLQSASRQTYIGAISYGRSCLLFSSVQRLTSEMGAG